MEDHISPKFFFFFFFKKKQENLNKHNSYITWIGFVTLLNYWQST